MGTPLASSPTLPAGAPRVRRPLRPRARPARRPSAESAPPPRSPRSELRRSRRPPPRRRSPPCDRCPRSSSRSSRPRVPAAARRSSIVLPHPPGKARASPRPQARLPPVPLPPSPAARPPLRPLRLCASARAPRPARPRTKGGRRGPLRLPDAAPAARRAESARARGPARPRAAARPPSRKLGPARRAPRGTTRTVARPTHSPTSSRNDSAVALGPRRSGPAPVQVDQLDRSAGRRQRGQTPQRLDREHARHRLAAVPAGSAPRVRAHTSATRPRRDGPPPGAGRRRLVRRAGAGTSRRARGILRFEVPRCPAGDREAEPLADRRQRRGRLGSPQALG